MVYNDLSTLGYENFRFYNNLGQFINRKTSETTNHIEIFGSEQK